MAYVKKTQVKNASNVVINPSTEEKQDALNAKDFSTSAKQDDIINNQTNGTQRAKIYANSADVDTQHPLPTNWDSVYAKDIDTDWSSVWTFTGDITSLVDDLDTTFSSTWHSSPANFTIKFKRPVTNNWIKFCSPIGKNFSNVKITLKDRSWTSLFIVDESSDNTDKSSEEYFWPQKAFCTILVEFYTTDDIDINLALLEKSTLVHTSNKFVDKNNSTTTPLVWDDTWVWEWIKTTNYIQAVIDVITDQDSATGGLLIEIKTTVDGVEVIHTHTYDVLINTPWWHHFPSELEWEEVRISYTNWTTTQTSFKLVTTLFNTMVEEWHAHNLNYALDDDHPAPIFRAVQTGKKPNWEYVNAEYTAGWNPKAAIEEVDPEVIQYFWLYPDWAWSNWSVTLTNADTAYAIPATAPTWTYRINLYNGSDKSIFVWYENSNANWLELPPWDYIEDNLWASQQLYAYCATAWKALSYSYKEVI